MAREGRKRSIQIVVEDGEAAAVIVRMQEYVEMLERLEDLEDLEMLNEMRSRPLEFRSLDDHLEQQAKEEDGDDTLSFASRWRGQFGAAERNDARYDALAKKYLQ